MQNPNFKGQAAEGSLDYETDDLAQKRFKSGSHPARVWFCLSIVNGKQLLFLLYRFKDLAMLDHKLEVDKEDIINVCCTVLNVTTKEISVY